MFKSTLFTVTFYLSMQFLLAQQVTFQSHQKYTYTDESGYSVKDMLYNKGELVIVGHFSDNGSHPIATKFNSKGEFARDLYWDGVIGVLNHVNKVNDTCLSLYGSFQGRTLSTLANTYLYQCNISNYKDYKDYNTELLASYYNSKGQMINVLTHASSQIKIQTLLPNADPTVVVMDETIFDHSCYFSNTGKTVYAVSYYNQEVTAEIFKYDVSNPLKPLLIAKTMEQIPFRYKDFVTNVTDDGFTVISSAYETSEAGAYDKTFTTERSCIKVYTETTSGTYSHSYLKIKDQVSVTNEETDRGPEYLFEYGKDQFVEVWVGYTGVYIELVNEKLEVIATGKYTLPADMEPLLTNDVGSIKAKMLDDNTLGVLYPYAKPGDENSKINTWELLTFTLQ